MNTIILKRISLFSMIIMIHPYGYSNLSDGTSYVLTKSELEEIEKKTGIKQGSYKLNSKSSDQCLSGDLTFNKNSDGTISLLLGSKSLIVNLNKENESSPDEYTNENGEKIKCEDKFEVHKKSIVNNKKYSFKIHQKHVYECSNKPQVDEFNLELFVHHHSSGMDYKINNFSKEKGKSQTKSVKDQVKYECYLKKE